MISGISIKSHIPMNRIFWNRSLDRVVYWVGSGMDRVLGLCPTDKVPIMDAQDELLYQKLLMDFLHKKKLRDLLNQYRELSQIEFDPGLQESDLERLVKLHATKHVQLMRAQISAPPGVSMARVPPTAGVSMACVPPEPQRSVPPPLPVSVQDKVQIMDAQDKLLYQKLLLNFLHKKKLRGLFFNQYCELFQIEFDPELPEAHLENLVELHATKHIHLMQAQISAPSGVSMARAPPTAGVSMACVPPEPPRSVPPPLPVSWLGEPGPTTVCAARPGLSVQACRPTAGLGGGMRAAFRSAAAVISEAGPIPVHETRPRLSVHASRPTAGVIPDQNLLPGSAMLPTDVESYPAGVILDLNLLPGSALLPIDVESSSSSETET